MEGDILIYLQCFKKERKKVVLSLFLTLLQAVTLLPVPIIIKYVFDSVLQGGVVLKLAQYLFLVFVLFLFNSVAILLNRHVTLSVIKGIVADFRHMLIERSLVWGRSFYSSKDLELVHSRIVQDTERLDCMTSALLTQFLPGILIVSGLSFLLLYLNSILFLVIISFLPILFFIGKRASVKVKGQVQIFHDHFSKFSKATHFVLAFNELISHSVAEEMESKRQKKIIEDLRVSSHKMAWLSTAFENIQNNILIFGGILVLFVGGLQVSYGIVGVGSLLSFYIALNLLSSNTRMMISTIPTIIAGRESLSVITPLLSDVGDVNLRSSFCFDFENSIVFKNVKFDYGTQFKLNNVNFSIEKNEIIGLFGASGSGKSTLINLILGFCEPKQGEIVAGGKGLKDINIKSYRRGFGVLPQEPLIFPGTIYENLVYGLDSVDESEVVRMCKLCNIDSFIRELPDKYHSDIGNRGVKISGGQKQRIAIARALLRKPRILILDEPDNNLSDVLTLDILQNIKQMNVGMIIVTHNDDFAQYVDKILTIKDSTVYSERIKK